MEFLGGLFVFGVVCWLAWSFITTFFWTIVIFAVIGFVLWLVFAPSQKRRRDRGDGFFDDWDFPDFGSDFGDGGGFDGGGGD